MTANVTSRMWKGTRETIVQEWIQLSCGSNALMRKESDKEDWRRQFLIAEPAFGAMIRTKWSPLATRIVLMPKVIKDDLTSLALQEYEKLKGSGSVPDSGSASASDLPF